MTWHHIAYLVSIIITSLVMGGIAWYSRKNRATVAGAGVYMWIAVLVSLLSVFQGVSLIGPTEEWALLWFNLRIPCFAVISVLWLIFVFHYIGKRQVLTRTRIAALFLVPLITQAMLWTNPLHGLWVVHEAAFSRAGPLFVPDLSTRVLGPFFLVHTIYTQLVSLAGLVILLAFSARMKPGYRGQAAWLGGGTLLMLVGALFPTFNLVPGLKLNLLPQSFAIGSLAVAWGIFRHRFLAEPLPMDRRKPIPVALVSLFVALTAGIVVAGFMNYQQYRNHHRAQAERQLLSIAELKVEEIDRWRRERLGDGAALRGNALFNALARRCLYGPPDESTRWQMNTWLETVRSAYQYDSVFLMDLSGAVRLDVAGKTSVVPSHVSMYLDQARRADDAIMSDFHRERPDMPIHLSVIAPLADLPGAGSPFGYVVLVINPDAYLYPMIARWPVPSGTAETLLVRKDDDSVLFLNELKFMKHTALKMRIPLARTETPAVMAVLGKKGVVEGLDYRTVPVIAAVEPVPDSPWFMVARMDADEVYAPVRERFWYMVVMMLVLIGGAGAGTLVVWRRSEERHGREMFRSAEELHESEEKFREVFDSSTVGKSLTAPDGRFLRVNRAFAEMLGYSVEELQRADFASLTHPEDVAISREGISSLLAGECEQYRFEKRYLRKDGTVVWADVGTMLHRNVGGEPEYFITSINDTTDRKRAEEALRDSEEKFSLAFTSSPYAITITRPTDGTFIDVNEAFSQISGYDRQEALEDSSIGLKLWVNGEERNQMIRDLMAGDKISGREYCFRRKNGVVMTGLFSAVVLTLKKERVVLASINDITDRSKAEVQVRTSEKRFRSLFENMLNGFAYCKMLYEHGAPVDFIYLDVNSSFEKLTGLKDIVGKKVSAVIPGVRETNPELLEIYGRVAATGAPESFESYVKGLDMWFSVTVYSPEREYFVSVFDVITERKRAERALKESEEFTRTVLDNLPVGIAVNTVEPDVRFVYMNDNFATLYRTSRELLEDPDAFWDAVYEDPAFREQIRKRVLEDCASGDPGCMYWADIPIERKGEKTTYVTARNIPLAGKGMMISVVWDVTDRKLAEQALAEREAKYRELVQNANSVIVRWKTDGTVTFFNEYAQDFFGYGEEEIVGRHVGILVPGQESTGRDLSGLVLDIAEHPEQYANNINENVCKDGRRVWMVWTNKPIYNDQGRVVEMLAIGSDITEQKRVEDTLAESERKYRLLADNMVDFISVSDLDYKINYISPSIEKALGFTFEELQSLPLNSYMSEESIASMARMLSEEIEIEKSGDPDPGRHRTYEVEYIRKDGGRMICELKSSALRDAGGNAIGLLNVGRDITDRKRADRALLESERKFRETVTTLDEGYYSCLMDGMLLEHNRAFSYILGFEGDRDLKGVRLPDFWQNPAERGPYLDLLKSEGTVRNYQVDAKKIGGEKITVILNSHIVYDESGAPARIEGTFIDITDRVRMEDELREVNERLRFLVDANIIGVLRANENGALIDANDYYLAFLGYTHEEFEKGLINWKDRTPPEHLASDERAIAELREHGRCTPYEKEYIRKDGSRVWVYLVDAMLPDGSIAAYALDITARKRAEEALRISNRFLKIAYSHTEMKPLLDEYVRELKQYTGCSAVAIRLLNEEGGIPYISHDGFSGAFIEKESPLSIVFDRCMCINVIKGTTDPAQPFYTEGGSFYMNGTTRFLATVSEEDKGATRNVCNKSGYESVALVPIRMGDDLLGLIHIADRREGMVPLETIKSLEKEGMQLGTAISRLRADERVLQLNRRLALLSTAVSRLASARDQDTVMAVVRSTARGIAGADGVTFVLKDGGQCYYADEDAIGPLWKGQRFPLSQCVSGWAMLNRESAVIEDVYADARVPQEAYRKTFVKSMVMVPIRRSEPIGAIGCYWANRYRPDVEEVGLIEALAEAAGTALDSIALYRDLEERVRERTAMLEEANASIIENSVRIEDLYNRAPCGYHSLDENGRFVEINDTELEWFGYRREEVIGTLGFVDIITEASRRTFEGNFPKFKEKGFIRDLEFEIIRKDGSILPVLVSATAIRDESGRYVRSRSTVMDFSEVKNARDALTRYAARLEETNRELEAFSYSVSHDLRAPLRSIDGFSQVILEDYARLLDDTARNYLDRIRTATRRMDRLIDDLLSLSRLGRTEMRTERVDLGAMARTILGELAARDPGRTVDITIADGLVVTGDPALLKVTLENLLNNAWKFTSRKKRARIELGVTEKAGVREFFVRDNGAGFDMKYADRLFGPFQRLHSTTEFEGTGIGLALVRRIVGRHGGTIRAESEEGKGACFYFTLAGNHAVDDTPGRGGGDHA